MGQAQSQSSPLDCDECYRPIKTEYEPVRGQSKGEWEGTSELGHWPGVSVELIIN